MKKTQGFTLTPKFFGVTLRSKGGFTLIETLVAVTILTLAAAGPLALAAKSLGTASMVKNQATAFYLAQEALETVTNLRDNNYLTENKFWLQNIDGCEGKNCEVDPQSAPAARLRSCGAERPENNCHYLRYDPSSGLYGHGGLGRDTIFKRYIYVERLLQQPEPDEIRVTATVIWKEGTRVRKVVAVKNLYDWR